jgi:stage II sporulation protein D
LQIYFIPGAVKEVKRIKNSSSQQRQRCCLGAVIFLLLTAFLGCAERQLVRLTPQMDVDQRFWVRVLLFENIKACTIKAPSGLTVLDDRAQTTLAYLTQSNLPVDVTASAGAITIGGQTYKAGSVTILPDSPYILNINDSDYRGKLQLTINPAGDSLIVVNLVPLEAYLASVVGAEMPSYWEPAALDAQAIAARTYCLYIKKRFGTNRRWDLRQTAANQSYPGISAESAPAWEAVERTYGQVLVCRQPDGTEDIFPAYYSSACGGHTENSQNVFGDSFEPLRGVPCPYCYDAAKPEQFFWPMQQFSKAYVSEVLLRKYPKLKQLGEIINIKADRLSDYGNFSRFTMVELVGTNGSDKLRAEDFRLAIDPDGRNFKSTVCQIANLGDNWAFLSGRGWGHGVGMCQHGAEAMARTGKSSYQILSYYYPGSRILTIAY